MKENPLYTELLKNPEISKLIEAAVLEMNSLRPSEYFSSKSDNLVKILRKVEALIKPILKLDGDDLEDFPFEMAMWVKLSREENE